MSSIPVSSLIVEDWFNGFYSAVMITTVWTIFRNTHYDVRKKVRLLFLVAIMYIFSTLHSSLNWAYYSKAIDDNESPDGPGLLFSLTHFKPWIEATGDTFFCLNILVADCLFIWRCWVVWQRRWILVIMPMLATIAGAVCACFVIFNQVTAEMAETPITAIKKGEAFVTFSTAYFALSISTSLTTTLLIALRIYLVQRTNRKNGNTSGNSYSAVIEILVESASLYSATLLIFVILESRKNINLYYAQNIHAQVAGLAPMLIILRVAAGHARPDDEWSTRPSTGLRFSPGEHTSNMQSDPSMSTTNQRGSMHLAADSPLKMYLTGQGVAA